MQTLELIAGVTGLKPAASYVAAGANVQLIEDKRREWPLLALKVRVRNRYWTLNRPASFALQTAGNLRSLMPFRTTIGADNCEISARMRDAI